ncbi:MAG: sugar phosphate isomerase/epimerase family protein [Armatimonadota bacterium]|nr:sugar phosphate isomerase/epimerase family protein [Armatimonadota bacterium]
MKLSLLTYNLGRDFELDELIRICEAYDYEGIEFRSGVGPHGVELEASEAERAEIREKMAASRLEIAGIGTSCRFESLDDGERQEQIDEAKAFIDLAADIGCPRIRVFGNSFPEGADRDVVVGNVGEALREIAEHAEPTGVDVNLELHGDFSYWKYTLEAVEIADHVRVGVVYNCNTSELAYGSIGQFLNPIAPYLRHVHMHELENVYPYRLLFRWLKDVGYTGFCSVESDTPSPDAERIIHIYSLLYRAWVESA